MCKCAANQGVWRVVRRLLGGGFWRDGAGFMVGKGTIRPAKARRLKRRREGRRGRFLRGRSRHNPFRCKTLREALAFTGGDALGIMPMGFHRCGDSAAVTAGRGFSLVVSMDSHPQARLRSARRPPNRCQTAIAGPLARRLQRVLFNRAICTDSCEEFSYGTRTNANTNRP